MLPDEVRDGLDAVERSLCANYLPSAPVLAQWQALRARLLAREAEVKVLRVKCAGSLANNLCPDHRDKQSGKSCLACTIERTEKRAERAEALLRECLVDDVLAIRGVNMPSALRRRITAHLSENIRAEKETKKT